MAYFDIKVYILDQENKETKNWELLRTFWLGSDLIDKQQLSGQLKQEPLIICPNLCQHYLLLDYQFEFEG